jgi:hypothetical protein
MEKAMATVDNQLVDYAYPMMLAQKALKDAHEAVLEKDFRAAIDRAYDAIAETKLMLNALKEMQELYR